MQSLSLSSVTQYEGKTPIQLYNLWSYLSQFVDEVTSMNSQWNEESEVWPIIEKEQKFQYISISLNLKNYTWLQSQFELHKPHSKCSLKIISGKFWLQF